MLTRAELKARAKEQIHGNILQFFFCMFVIFAINLALVYIPLGSIVSIIINGPIMLGMYMMFLGMARGEKVEIANLFRGFGNFKTSLLLNLLQTIFVFLWTLLLIVPGIIKSISYSMSYFILAENPEMTAKEALKESERLMDGHKMDFFVLGLSFIPWALLGAVTFGIAYIYVMPYMYQTYTNFYLNLKEQARYNF